jgi:hypothetical protein
MLGLSDARHFRRLVAGFCLIAAPIVLLVGAGLHPLIERDGAAHLAVVRENPDRYFVAHAILLLGLVLFLPAVLGLMHLLRQRATAFGHVGGGLAMIGLFGATAIVAVDGIAVSQMGRPGVSPAEMATLLDGIKESVGLRIVAVVAGISLLSSILLLAYGSWRARVLQPWAAGALAVAAIVFFLGQVTDNSRIFAAAFAIYLVALGPLGWRTLTESDEQWADSVRPGPASSRGSIP